MSPEWWEWSHHPLQMKNWERERGAVSRPNRVPTHRRQFLNLSQKFRFAERCMEMCIVQKSRSGQSSYAQETARVCGGWGGMLFLGERGQEREQGGEGKVPKLWEREWLIFFQDWECLTFDFKSSVVWDVALWLPRCDTERLDRQQGKGSVPFEPVTGLMRNCSRAWSVEFGY